MSPATHNQRPATLALVLLALLALGLSANPQWLQRFAFHPATAFSHPWWQWLSGHLLHITPLHLLANLLALLLLALWAWQRQRLAGVPPVLLMSALLVDCGLVVFGPHMDWYAGLSGALHGVFAWLALQPPHQRGRGRWQAVPALWLLGLLKLLLDQTAGLPWSGFQPVPQAHVYGFVAGTLAALPFQWRSRR